MEPQTVRKTSIEAFRVLGEAGIPPEIAASLSELEKP